MPAKIQSPDLSAIAEFLVCPACRGELDLDPDRLVCTNCSASYPIVDGIPVLIAPDASSSCAK